MKKTAFKELKGVSNFLKKLLNSQNKWQFIWYRLRWNLLPWFHWVSQFPVHIDIEITNCCNLRCVMCPHGFQTAEFKKGLGSMDFDLAQRIIDEGTKKGLASIKVNWRGEPLLWRKHLSAFIRYMKERGVIDVIMNTNGLLLDKEFSEDLIAARLDQIVFSVDGNSPENYQSIRKGGDFDKLVSNIEEFICIRNASRQKRPLVRVQMVKQDNNLHEVDGFVKRWSGLVDSITFQDYTNRGEDKERLNAFSDGFRKAERRACPQIWQRIVVTWDGKLIMCCRDWEAESLVGVLDYQNGKDIEYFWKGKVLSGVRTQHLRKKLDKVPVCAKCSYKESYYWIKEGKK